MRSILLTALLLTGCADEFAEAEKANTIEAWDAYLAQNADSMNGMRAKDALDKLMFEKAKASNVLEDYDAYLAKLPAGKSIELVKDAREALLLEAATATGDVPAYKRFLELCPDASTKRRGDAERGIAAASYALTATDVVTAQVNLAEDPKGPLNGWGFKAQITNAGDKTIESLTYRLDFLDASGKKVGSVSYPLVAPAKEWPTPVPDGWMVPMKPGEVRTFDYTTGDLPQGYGEKARLVPMRIRFAEGG